MDLRGKEPALMEGVSLNRTQGSSQVDLVLFVGA